jgi:hypothetical protein
LYFGWFLVIVLVNLWPGTQIFRRKPLESDPALRSVTDKDQTLSSFRNSQGRVRLGNYHADNMPHTQIDEGSNYWPALCVSIFRTRHAETFPMRTRTPA